MSVRVKVALILANLFALYCVATILVQRQVVGPSFAALERDQAQEDMERCVQALEREIYHLDLFCSDWSAWDDTCEFVQDRNADYVAANLVPSTFTLNDLNLIYVFDTTGDLVWGRNMDLETGEEVAVEALPARSWPRTHLLLRHQRPDSAIAGVWMAEHGPMLVSSRPIVTSEVKGPIRGTLVMGRLLTDEVVNTLAEQTLVNLKVLPLDTPNSGTPPQPGRGNGSQRAAITTAEQGEDALRVSTTYDNIQGHPALLLEADVPRDISARGRSATGFALTSLLVAGALVLLVTLAVCERTVIAPVSALTHCLVGIADCEDLEVALPKERGDEIGALAREFNRMLQRLCEARRKLLEQSYRAGRAEMAAQVLHNVRNELGPLMAAVDGLKAELTEIHPDRMEAARRELAEGAASPERTDDLRRYVELATSRLIALAREMPAKLDVALQRIGWIDRVLADHEEGSRAEPVLEPLRLDELVRDAAEVAQRRCDDGLSVELDSSLSQVGRVRAARLGLVEVIGHLLENAAEAKSDDGQTGVRVQVGASVEQQEGAPLTHLTVRDDGRGLDPDTVARAFERGFSTKEGGLGLGLHWSANTVAAMGGRMSIESDGVGMGASVHLLLPAAN